MKLRLAQEAPEAVEADAMAVVLFEATADDPNPGSVYDARTQGLILHLNAPLESENRDAFG